MALRAARRGLSSLLLAPRLRCSERSFVLRVLEMLRLMCEGHNERMQEFLRSQPLSLAKNNVDLVGDIYELLVLLESELTADNCEQAIKCVETLTELVQGNSSLENARLLLGNKTIEICDRLLQRSTFDDATEWSETRIRAIELRGAVLLLLLALLEGSSSQAERRMHSTLDLCKLCDVVTTSYGEYMRTLSKKRSSYSPSLVFARLEARAEAVASDEGELSLNAAFQAFLLLRQLIEYHEEATGEGAGLTFTRQAFRPNGASDVDTKAKLLRNPDQSAKPSKAAAPGGGPAGSGGGPLTTLGLPLEPSVLEHLHTLVARVEIVNASNELERVYFRVPAYCLLLSDESKQRLLWGVDRDTPGKQIQEFLAAAEVRRPRSPQYCLPLLSSQVFRATQTLARLPLASNLAAASHGDAAGARAA